MSNIRVASLKEPVDVGKYLFARIHELGIRSVHGVPGDYNLGRFHSCSKSTRS